MTDKQFVRISKFLSKHLRHAPEAIGLILEVGGWVDVEMLLNAVNSAGVAITRAELDEVVSRNDKQRFAFDETRTKIRANQGHSVDVDLQLEAADPPTILYHGTADVNLALIQSEGLKKMARHHVHLSADVSTARKVGGRHGKPLVFAVDTAAMRDDGVTFFRSANGVWLVDSVPANYLRVVDVREND